MSDQDDFEDSEDLVNLEERIRRGPLLGVLLWTAVISGVVWVIATGVVQIRQAAIGYPGLFGSEAEAEIYFWSQAVGSIANSIFLVAVGSYILVWLRVRPGVEPHP